MKPNGIVAPPAGIDSETNASERAVVVTIDATARSGAFLKHLGKIERLNCLIFSHELLIIPDKGTIHKRKVAKRSQTKQKYQLMANSHGSSITVVGVFRVLYNEMSSVRTNVKITKTRLS